MKEISKEEIAAWEAIAAFNEQATAMSAANDERNAKSHAWSRRDFESAAELVQLRIQREKELTQGDAEAQRYKKVVDRVIAWLDRVTLYSASDQDRVIRVQALKAIVLEGYDAALAVIAKFYEED